MFNNGISTDANPIKDDISHSAYEIPASGDPQKKQLGGLLQLLPFVGVWFKVSDNLGPPRITEMILPNC